MNSLQSEKSIASGRDNSFQCRPGVSLGLKGLGRITQLMENLGVVETFALKTVMGKKVEYRVQIYGDIDRLSKALELSREFQPAQMIDTGDSRDGPMTDPNRLYFRLLPPLQPGLNPTDVLADSNDE